MSYSEKPCLKTKQREKKKKKERDRLGFSEVTEAEGLNLVPSLQPRSPLLQQLRGYYFSSDGPFFPSAKVIF